MFDAYMNIDGIEGESSDDKHQGWIELLPRFGIGVKQSISTTASSAGGASAERADFSDFIIRKYLDKSSPELALACAAGTHIDQIIVEVCRAGTDKQVFMTYTMTNFMISKVRTDSGSDAGNAFPAETIHIAYGKIELKYAEQNRKGGGIAGNVIAGWNLEKNRKM